MQFSTLELDTAAVYAATRAETVALCRPLDPADARRMVPTCPQWSVTDTVAHVVGIASDVLEGRLEGLGSDEWTAAQVAGRVGRSLGEICDEWERLAPAIERFCINDAFFGLRINADAVCHLHDIYSAVGRVGDRSSLGVRAALERYGPLCVERIAGYAADPADPLPERTVLALDADGQRYVSGGSAPSATLRASPFELLRAISGRRSRRQIEAMDWTGDPSPLIDRLSVYGMPSQDVVEPAAG